MSKFSTMVNTTPTVRKIRAVPGSLRHAMDAAMATKAAAVGMALAHKQKPSAAPTIVMPHHYAKTTVRNEAGGKAFRKSEAFELLSLVVCSLLSKKGGKYYESEASSLARAEKLVASDPYFAAQVAVWARRALGLRSITHAITAMVAKVTKGQGHPWVKTFVEAVVFRPDDAIEIVAAYFHLYGKGKSIRKPNGKRGKKTPVTLPYPLKKGLAKALAKCDGYQLAKYQKKDGAIGLADVFNLVHPAPPPESQEVFRAFMSGDIKNIDTWEARLSQAGSNTVKKEEVWCGLLEERKLGYFAALRNLRNIIEQAPGAVPAVIKLITSKKAVERCLILPFQFMRAYKEVAILKQPTAREVARAVETAVELSIANIPKLPGRTLVALDESGSMRSKEDENAPAGIGSLFAGMLLKSQPGAQFMSFATDARYHTIDTSGSLFSVVAQIRDQWTGGSTNFHNIFERALGAYDNIIILSDNEGWTLGNSWEKEMGAPTSARRRYEQLNNIVPFMVVFDLAGMGSSMFPEDSIAVLGGFSDKVFTLLAELRKDPQAFVNEVRKVSFSAVNAEDEE